jgi:glucose/arabinose dehydrogenase
LHGAEGWPQEYRNDLLVAYHGSWNRSVPTGYKLVRMRFSEAGEYVSTEDFITGWLSDGTVYGRPVDLEFGPDGALYLSDDRAGVIYRIRQLGDNGGV